MRVATSPLDLKDASAKSGGSSAARKLVSFVTDGSTTSGEKAGRVRGLFLILLGFIVLGLGASMYYGALDLGSLTQSGTPTAGSALAIVPEVLGAVLIVGGLVISILDRRRPR
jgi:hypothetical protein